MTTYQSRGGTDVQLTLQPDTPTNWTRLAPAALTHLDRLTSALNDLSPDWQVDIYVGPETHLTAEPANTENDAA